MTHNDLKAKLIAEWKASAAYKRIEALESYAHAHGWRAFDGEIIPDFLSRTHDEIARAVGEELLQEKLWRLAIAHLTHEQRKGVIETFNALVESRRQLTEHLRD